MLELLHVACQFGRHPAQICEFAPRNRRDNFFGAVFAAVVGRDGFGVEVNRANRLAVFDVTCNAPRHAQPYFAVTEFFRVVEFGVTRLLAVSLARQARHERFFKADVRQFFKPIRAERVEVVAEHFLIVRDHVFIGNFVAELPTNPVDEFFRHGRAAVATRLRD